MSSIIVPITAINNLTHDVKSFRVAKPARYEFVPGQATELSINQPGWEEERRPFTFTSLATDPWLEFTIKRYADHNGVTNQLHQLTIGDELILRDTWGAIEYKGPGYFIAGGAGITPFLAILRQLHQQKMNEENILFFSNKTSGDIILEEELKSMLDSRAHFLLSREEKAGYETKKINEDFLRENITDLSKHFYICGPDKMVADISALLENMGVAADAVLFEK